MYHSQTVPRYHCYLMEGDNRGAAGRKFHQRGTVLDVQLKLSRELGVMQRCTLNCNQ